MPRGLTPMDAWRSISPESLSSYVSEEENPENEKGVIAVEVFEPSPLLADGLSLVDTPGLGSVFEANTIATHAFIPQIDAAIVVIGADPPVSGEELDLVAAAAAHIRNLVFVLNKADRVTEEERRVASQFTRTVVERRLGRRIDQIFWVSAVERMAGAGPERDWQAFVASLQSLVATSGTQLIRDAARRGWRSGCSAPCVTSATCCFARRTRANGTSARYRRSFATVNEP